MKNYIVAVISFFDNEIKQFEIVAESEYHAVKKAMIEFCHSEEGKKSEIEYQNSENYPTTLDDLYYEEMDYSVTEVYAFIPKYPNQ